MEDVADWVEISVNEWLRNQEEPEEENITLTYDSAMLANEGGTPGVETELYDSGASRHMSPYRHHFINYTSIAPKSITAADNGSFLAIGQGDMRISIPNGKNTTTILLKGVLYAPKLGLTLVSISKVTDAKFCALFRDDVCRIFDEKRKLLGAVKKTNGTYRVQHDATPVIAASAIETISVEELHRRMGHIAPEAAKCLVKDGLVTGIKLDESTHIESCDSCRYAKTTRKPVAKVRKEKRAAAMGDLIHSDVWGPSPTEMINRREYYSSFTDDHTRWSRLYLQRTKDASFDSYQAF
jgi:mRNA-degrading endonuclease toxin of MazEF toxin-antitoxin module